MKTNTTAKVLAGLLGLASAAMPAVAQTTKAAVAPFYADLAKRRPDGPLGQVIKRENVATDIPAAVAWRIAYISSDVLNRKTISTALVVAPKGEMPKEGRPIIAWAHGTTGTAQTCGPSQIIDPARPLNQYFLVGGNSWTDYGLPAVETFVKQGYVVVGTDYQGLGGGGKHQYVVAASQAKDAINSIRAVGAMNLAGANRKAVIYGWSQGGGTTLAAASLAAYIGQNGTAFDGINIVGFVALAPQDVAVLAPKTSLDDAAAQKMLSDVTTSFADNVFNFAHLSMTFWANAATFPTLKLTDVFTEEGAKVIDDVMSAKCVHAAADTLSAAYGNSYKTLLKTTPSNAQAWAKALIEGSVAPVKPVAPVVIYWGTKDTVVPPIMGKLYQDQMCGLGGNVARVTLPGEQTHYTTPGSAEPLYVAWINKRLKGATTADGCQRANNETAP
jgi:pimeloyl-ACP methyl ester carboxylesterase